MKTLTRKSHLERTLAAFDTRLPRASRRQRFEGRLNRQWRQKRHTLIVIGGTLAFFGGLLWPTQNAQEPAPRMANNALSQNVSR